MVDISFVANGQGPPLGGPRVDLLYPKPGGRVTGYVTADDLVTVWTHWLVNSANLEARTVPCIQPEHHCEGCRRGRKRLWKGYLACWSDLSCKPFVAEITAQAARQAPRLTLGNLRGMLLTLERPGRSRQGRVWAMVQVPARPVELPPPVNVIEVLYRLWGFRRTDGAGPVGPTTEGGGA